MKAKLLLIIFLIAGIILNFFITYFQALPGYIATILSLTLIVLGIYLLVAGGDLLVEGSVGIAKKFKLSPLVIGLTIVSFGTSAPEFFINVLASLKGQTQLLISNIIGSNLANILLILGVSAIVAKRALTVRDSTLYKEIPFSLLAVVVLFFLVNDVLIDGLKSNVLSHIDGLILLSFFVVFMYYIYSLMQNDNSSLESDELSINYSIFFSIIFVILGMLGLYFGGELVVNNAVWLAEKLGVSTFLIGATIVAIGTSLPELVASVVSSWKGYTDMAIGNVIGSNIFNIFWIGGVSALIHKVPFDIKYDIDIILLILATLILFMSVYLSKNRSLNKFIGIIFVILYFSYLVFVIRRG